MRRTIRLTVNGADQELTVEDNWILSDVLHDQLKLYSVREGCGVAACGACTVLIDGQPAASCLTLAARLDGSRLETIEGLRQGGMLHPIQQSFLEHSAFQCGYCTPGFVLTVKALLDQDPNPTEENLQHYLAGNFCRCGSYADILRAARSSIQKMSGLG